MVTSRPHPQRPPIPYFGGKITLGPAIAQVIEGIPHGHYVEPYAGSAAVLLARSVPAKHETLNDLDGRLMTFWRVLRDHPEELIRACALTPHSRAEYEACRDAGEEECGDVESARRTWVTLTQARAGSQAKTGWRHYIDPSGPTSMPGYLAGYVDRMAAVTERLRSVSLECRPALDLIERYGRSPDVLLYVDPPYLGTTRASRGYRLEMPGQAEHLELSSVLHDCEAAVVLSGYPDQLYDSLYEGWERVEMSASTGQGGTWANRTEVLWVNRPLGGQQALWADQ